MKKQLLSILLMFFVALAFAQVTTSNIKGLVLDEMNEPLPGANVLAVHTPTGTKFGGATNFDGRFNLLNLKVGGPYSITISFVGYKEQAFTDVYLTLGKTQNLDITMASDSQSLETVVITGTGGTGTFGSDRTGAETSVGRRELTSLPTISRSAADFTRLEPSSSGNSFGGRNDQFNNFSLDGAVFGNPFGLDAATVGGQTDAQPISLDAIDQIQVSLAPYDVTQSGFTGASVNAVTKSGTNEFHGTVYGFTRNEDLTGGKIKGEDVFKADLEQTQYGLSVGGPLIKNKLFFFANFEKDERTDLGAPFTPNRGSGAVNESIVAEQDLMDVSNALLNLGYNPGRYEGFNYNSNSTKGIFKIDWNINDNNRLAVIYNFLDASKEKPAHPTAIGVRGPSFRTLQFENSGYEINNKLNSFQIELNSTLPGDVTNKLQIGYTHFDDFRNPLSGPAPVIAIQDGAGSNYIIAGHEPFSINNKLDQRVFQVTDNMNFVKGDHTFTVGFNFEKFEFKNSFNLVNYESFNFGIFPYYGLFSPYPDVQTFLDNAQPGGVVDQYLGATQNAFNQFNANGDGNDGGWKLAELNVGQLAFYVQDEWNVTDNFKLTYGIRLDKPLYFDTADLIQKYINTENGATRDNSVTYFNPNTNEEVTLESTKLPDSKPLISPRVGFNYDVKGDNTFQVRGGSGVFTGRFPFVWLGNQVSGADDGFFQIIDPEYKWPQVWRTNIGGDYKFDNGVVLTADVSYTKDINGAHVQNWGLRNPTETLNAPGDNRPVYADGDKGNNAYVFTNSNKGRIWNYTLKAQKTFGKGFYTSLAYNHLDSKDVNSIEAEITGDAFDFNQVSGNANDAVLSASKYGDKHRFIGVASKKFTYANDKWSTTLSTFFEYAQGGRFSYTYAGNINNDSSGQNNDLLYVPTAGELQQMQFSGTPAEQATQAANYEAYIQQDDYLSEKRGDYTDRYGALAPWRGKWDVKLLQDYKFSTGDGKTNTIQISVDVLNVGNLLNSDWGIVQLPNNVSPVSVSVDQSTNTPTYSFNESNQETFGYNTSLLSRWQAQVGVRYIF